MRACDGNARHVAQLAQRQPGQATGNGHIGDGPGERAGKACAVRLHRQGAAAVDVQRTKGSQLVGRQGDVAGGSRHTTPGQITQRVGVAAIRHRQPATSAITVQADGAALGQHIGIAQTEVLCSCAAAVVDAIERDAARACGFQRNSRGAAVGIQANATTVGRFQAGARQGDVSIRRLVGAGCRAVAPGLNIEAPGFGRDRVGETGQVDVAIGTGIHVDTLPSLNANR